MTPALENSIVQQERQTPQYNSILKCLYENHPKYAATEKSENLRKYTKANILTGGLCVLF